MTIQKSVKWINVNSVITTVCTAVLIWVGVGVNKLYNQIKDQPGIDEKQNNRIESLQKNLAERTVDIELNKIRINTNERKIAVINAIFPQTKIEK